MLDSVNVRECIVSYQDLDGVTHSVRVHAASIYQAAALAVIEFRNHEFFDDKPGNGSTLTMKVTTATVHELTVNKVIQWLDRKPKDGIDLMEKARLKRLLVKSAT
jgi:hypothetical protein